MLKYSELLPHHISMLLVALNAYGNTPFDGKLLKVGAVLCFPAFSACIPEFSTFTNDPRSASRSST